ncbi:MAG: aspartate aminotransferase family protein, partial [Chitinophagaceae bacterium]|nr:aspartate aminotransferase family protein [Chitinophagaceae bacterium]
MDELLRQDLNQLELILSRTQQFSVEYLEGINSRRVSSSGNGTSLPALPATGFGAMESMNVFEKQFYPNILASSGPRYWGFVTGGTTPAAIAGDWLSTVFDQNTQSANGNGDSSALLEMHTAEMLLDLFSLPQEFIGAFVSGATMSNFTGLAVARQWVGQQKGIDIARDGMKSSVNVIAAVPHSSAIKALAMLGVGSNNIILVPTIVDREAIDLAKLEACMETMAGEPFILISSAGTVNTVDFDDLNQISFLKQRYNFWWHIDAAFGGFAACSPAHQHLLAGWESADSITVDFHKWLNVPYDSAIIFTRKQHAVLQVQTFQNSNAPYLGDPMQNFNYLNYVPENSRRFRALPAWFTLMAYGKKGYQTIVEKNIHLARVLGQQLEASEKFILVSPVRLNTVCFTTKEPHNRSSMIETILGQLRIEGKLFVTPTSYQGISCIRAALVN